MADEVYPISSAGVLRLVEEIVSDEDGWFLAALTPVMSQPLSILTYHLAAERGAGSALERLDITTFAPWAEIKARYEQQRAEQRAHTP